MVLEFYFIYLYWVTFGVTFPASDDTWLMAFDFPRNTTSFRVDGGCEARHLV